MKSIDRTTYQEIWEDTFWMVSTSRVNKWAHLIIVFSQNRVWKGPAESWKYINRRAVESPRQDFRLRGGFPGFAWRPTDGTHATTHPFFTLLNMFPGLLRFYCYTPSFGLFSCVYRCPPTVSNRFANISPPYRQHVKQFSSPRYQTQRLLCSDWYTEWHIWWNSGLS